MATIDDYVKAAGDRFELLPEAIWKAKDFWRKGNTFDTIIDYLTIVSDKRAEDIARLILAEHARHAQGGLCLYDDHGWWGIACLRASHAAFFKEHRQDFRTIAENCWNAVHLFGTQAWERVPKDDRTYFAGLAPRHAGGVWNCIYTKAAIPDDCSTPCNPIDGDAIRGFQNTVTNALYFDLCGRAFVAYRDQKYRDDGQRIHDFLTCWFEEKATDEIDPLLYRYDAEGQAAIVRERISAYADPRHGNKTTMRGYQPGLAWAGDQGLVLGGLVSWLDVTAGGSTRGDELGLARLILNGIAGYLADPETRLLKNWEGGTAPGGDVPDYSTGISICMRYLLYAHEANRELRAVLHGADWTRFFTANADHVLHSTTDTDPNWRLINATNELAVLLTAIAVLRAADSD